MSDPRPNREQPLVLVVDDDALLREMTRVALENAGFGVLEAEDGETALSAFEEGRPDIVLLDVLMPGVDGFETCRRLRGATGGLHLPIVMVTGLDDTDSIDKAYDSGATDFFTKPIHWAVLGYRIRYILRASRAEQRAYRNFARLRDAIECFPAGFQLFGPDDRLVISNSRNAHDVPNLRHLFVPGTPRREIVEASAAANLLAETAGPSAAEHSDVVRRWSDGRWFRVIEQRTADGGTVVLRIDITADKERELALHEAKERAELADRSKSEFLANMSHELRTPLNAVIGFSEVLLAEAFGPLGAPQYTEYVDDIRCGAQHLLDIINDILDMSKIEAGVLELDETEVDLHETVEICLRLITERARSAGVALEVEIAATLPHLLADARLLKQILLNLLSNAVKFTPKGGIVRVCGAHVPGEGLEITVQDSGIGISREDLPRVLKPFGQADGALSRKYEGTGLGLPLSVAMAEMHGGRLILESEPGVGTTARVRFPDTRSRAAAPAAAVAAAG